jgi:hypothetical protein
MSLDIYWRTLKAGKKVVILGVNPAQIQSIFDAVGCDGIFISVFGDTRKNTDDLIETAHKNKWIR